MEGSLRMNFFALFNVLLFNFVVPSNGIATWCEDHLQGFDLDTDYNPNSPPTKHFKLRNNHILNKVDEVKKHVK